MTDQTVKLILELETIDELHMHYMPFLKNGGLFVSSVSDYSMGTPVLLSVLLPDALEAEDVRGEVAWISAKGQQSNIPQGVGIAFDESSQRIRDIIEKLLGNKIKSTASTYTM